MPELSQLQLGYIAGVHGVRGALRAKLFNAESTTLEPGLELHLRERGGGAGERYEVLRVAPKPGGDFVRLWLVGVDGRDAAEALRGRELWVERSQLPALEDDEFYLADLIGQLVVREGAAELESLGEIVGVTSNTAQDLLCVRLDGREWLLPAIAPFIVAIDERGVVVDVHDDMLPEPSE